MRIGYPRVSKADGSQSLDLQRDALQAGGVDAGHVYHDCASGVRDDRPGLDSCVRALRKGDVARRLEVRPPRPQPRPPGQHRAGPVARGVGLRVLTGQGAQILSPVLDSYFLRVGQYAGQPAYKTRPRKRRTRRWR